MIAAWIFSISVRSSATVGKRTFGSGGVLASLIVALASLGFWLLNGTPQEQADIPDDDWVRLIDCTVGGKAGRTAGRNHTTRNVSGPVNAAAPKPVTNWEFTKTLGHVLGRPSIFPMPALAVRLAFGEMGKELLLASSRIEPARLLTAGYQFQFPQLESALRHLLNAE